TSTATKPSHATAGTRPRGLERSPSIGLGASVATTSASLRLRWRKRALARRGGSGNALLTGIAARHDDGCRFLGFGVAGRRRQHVRPRVHRGAGVHGVSMKLPVEIDVPVLRNNDGRRLPEG